MAKILIAYATKGGVTREVAEVIAAVLRDSPAHEVTLHDLRDKQEIQTSDYDAVIAGAGVRMQRIYRHLYKFLRAHDLTGNKLAVYVVCNEAGNPKQVENTRRKYLEKVQKKCPNVSPEATEAFGGRMQMFGKVVDTRDMERVRQWARSLSASWQ